MKEVEQIPIEELMGNFEKELAKKYKVSQLYISLKIEEYYEQKNKRNQEIVGKWRNGATKAELADEYGIPQNAIYIIIRRYSEEKEEEDKDQEIAEKWENGAKRRELADEYGVSESTISNIIRKYYNGKGKENPRKPKILSEEEIKEIVEKWENGATRTALAEEYGVSEGTIYVRVQKYYEQSGEQNPRQHKTLSEEEIKEVVEQWEDGKTLKEIATSHGVSESMIDDKIKKHNKTGAKVLKATTIIVEYLKKGLKPEQIVDIARGSNIIIPENVMQDAIKKFEGTPNLRIKEDTDKGIGD